LFGISIFEFRIYPYALCPLLYALCLLSMKNQTGSTVSPYVRNSDQGVVLKVQVQPRASRDEVVGPHGDALKIRITAAPVAGAANKHLLKFLAKKLRVARSQMSIASGATSRAKSIAIEGISAEEVRQRLTR
jgi:uncharacterized protein (TIGR00251 family)